MTWDTAFVSLATAAAAVTAALISSGVSGAPQSSLVPQPLASPPQLGDGVSEATFLDAAIVIQRNRVFASMIPSIGSDIPRYSDRPDK